MKTTPCHLGPRTIDAGDAWHGSTAGGPVPAPTSRGSAGQTHATRPPFAIRHSAFTLTELVVSIGVLSLMMTMVGSIFKMTLDSTGEATSLSKVTQRFRLLEETLRKDLAQVDPASSIMVIQASPINAYWRTEQAELDIADFDPSTGYPHALDPERDTTTLDPDGRPIPELPRADVLMFFASRKTNSYVCPDVWSNVVQVVYGHAELGELDAGGAWVGATPPDEFARFLNGTLTVLPTPAEKWHLARRSVSIVDGVVTGDCATRLMVDFALDVTGPNNWPDTLLDGEHDVVGENPGGPPSFDFIPDVIELNSVATVDLPDWFARSRMDLTPPALYGQRLGHYLLPHCASFKVEWALDLRDAVFGIPFTNTGPGSAPRELVWIDPAQLDAGDGHSMVELKTLAGKYGGMIGTGITAVRDTLWNRFESVGATGLGATTPLWYANDSINPGGSPGDPDRYFPKALRITVDVYDDSGRFTRPMRHVMVLRVGSG